ncbi:MAG: hypothetical protein H7334_13625 [Ferruginibacter sp.]|nr:hypothetical protein [Ferruginibacter sp.]
MSKEQFDHIENRIREAAENSEQAYDELAWNNMEAKLDKEKEPRRRFFMWWVFAGLSVLLLGVGAYLFYTRPMPEKNISSTLPSPINTSINTQHLDKKIIVDKESGLVGTNKNSVPVAQKDIAPSTIDKKADKEETVIPNGNSSSHKKNTYSLPIIKKHRVTHSIKNGLSKPANDAAAVAINTSANNKKNKAARNVKGRTNVTINSNDGDTVVQDSTIHADLLPHGTGDTGITVITYGKPKTALVTDSFKTKKIIEPATKDVAAKKIKKKNEDAPSSKFYVLGSIGADAGSVHLFSLANSTITPKYGVGIGYKLTNKLSVQTGFYASRKKYVAGPNDYTAKAGSYWGQVKLTKVNASCLIYEIPLAFRYDIVQRPSYKIYATAGVSSFIMKKEDYDYYYIRDNMDHRSSWTYTGNKNLFSIVSLSAGIEKKLSPIFSITAEPSVGLPIHGVGDGQVKLFSTAIQVGFIYQPLKKMHKK